MSESGKPARTVVDAASASARILDAAESLFYREGTRAVGVDAVVKQAGVNKMSLYRQFSSKDELLRQYLKRREAMFWGYFDGSVGQHPDDAAAALRQYFSDVTARATRDGYRGCPFVNVAAEYPEPDHFARRFVAEHKRQLLARLTALAAAAGARDPAALARALALLIEGLYTASQTYGTDSPVMAAVPQVADILVAQALGRDPA
ncbi:TetR/AcrR family transcriptional regulator [Chitiniphilus shinanonensis]|uniref:TetR/AcrR family transcriptional regulator n=1 Tax=Chitiniphilus shinanonensis TaxID=553088 RepID=UPI0030302043